MIIKAQGINKSFGELKVLKNVDFSVQKGEIVSIVGASGAGKTTFTKAVAEGLGIDNIQSPTFTIVREHGGRLSLLHFDAYRLSSEDDLYAIGFDDYLSRPSVIIMEWCENVPGALPSERLELHITGSGAEPRTLTFIPYGKKYQDLLENIKC